MLKIHHSSQKYDAALSDAAKVMRDKLHRQIEAGRTKGQDAIKRILTEVPEDQVVPGNQIKFEMSGPVKIIAKYGDQQRTVHYHAMDQMTEKMRLPRAYYNHLWESGDWGKELLVKNLTDLFEHSESKHLIRSVDNQIRGFLSTRYQRRHPAQMLEAFVQACSKVQAIPYEAYAGDTKYMVKAVVDRVIEPIRDEVIALGVIIHESPYGHGATEISPFIERMFCTNKAITTTELRKVHIGGRLTDNIAWSEDTYRKDTEAVCSQISDLVAGQLGEEAIQKLTDVVIRADKEILDPHLFESFVKKSLGKEEAQVVIDKYTSADIENLPQGHTVWRASNALSWFAGQCPNEEHAFEIQKLAGSVISSSSFASK